MSKGARTVADLDRAVSILKTRDSARARELKAIRGDLDAIERILTDERETLLRVLADHPLPAANSTQLSTSHSWRARAGAALQRARSFFLRTIGH